MRNLWVVLGVLPVLVLSACPTTSSEEDRDTVGQDTTIRTDASDVTTPEEGSDAPVDVPATDEGSASPVGGSCDFGTANYCVDFTGSSYTAAVRTQCEGMAGVYSTGGCDRTGNVGHCTKDAGTATESVKYWFPPMPAEAAQSACSSDHGAWTP